MRPSNEGLVRIPMDSSEFLPKGCDFRQVSDDEMQDIENKLNNRPRKRLGFKTPNQVFYIPLLLLQEVQCLCLEGVKY